MRKVDEKTLGTTPAAINLMKMINERNGETGLVCSTVQSFNRLAKSLKDIKNYHYAFILLELVWKEWVRKIEVLDESPKIKTHMNSVIKGMKNNLHKEIVASEEFQNRKELIKTGRIRGNQVNMKWPQQSLETSIPRRFRLPKEE